MLYATETRSIVTSLFDPEVVAIAIMSQGVGSMPTAGRDMISDASAQHRNKPIVVCLKTPDGFVGYPMYGTGNWAIPDGFMDALRCRLVLKLALIFRMDVEEIRSLFEVDALSARSHGLFIIRLHWFSFEQVIVQTKRDCESRLFQIASYGSSNRNENTHQWHDRLSIVGPAGAGLEAGLVLDAD
jgi:hypothetical protein